ncbi:MAG: CBS domain-containing protein [Bacteroidetes bacterium]|nr:CBS domain-containing protein [Bacteroidota bacterium]
MNILAPVSTIMSTKLITVNPKDELSLIKEIFEKHKIHHIPVVRYKKIIGLISKTDFFFFLRGFIRNEDDHFVNEARLRAYIAEDIMTKGLAKLKPSDRIIVALEIFKENLFHAIPVVENDELIGIITTYDIIKTLVEEKKTYQEEA